MVPTDLKFQGFLCPAQSIQQFAELLPFVNVWSACNHHLTPDLEQT